jgi:hypothetical protein
LDLLDVTGDVENPIVAFADEAVGRDRSAIKGYREGASEGAETGVDQ